MTTKVKSKVSSSHTPGEEIVDIPGSTLVEWLMNRNKLNTNWKRNYPRLLKLIENAQAIDEIEENTRKELKYYDCLKIFKEYESKIGGNTTSFFGSYTNANTQKWYEVVNLYEKDNLYLGETCQNFTQNINYEIPDCQKKVENIKKNIEEFNRKEIELNKSKNNAINIFKRSCNELDIKGESIRDEILSLPKHLVPLFDEISQILYDNKTIVAAINFYKEMLKLTKSEFKDENILPITLYLISHGNTSLLEREKLLNPGLEIPEQYQKQKKSVTSTTTTTTTNNNNSNNNGDKIEIDWCMDIESDSNLNSLEEPPVIVWEDGIDSVSSPTIQWDDFSMDTIELVGGEGSTVTLDNSSSSNSKEQKSNKKEKQIDFKKLFEETILSDNNSRNQFLDEVYEIELFLQYRINEMEKGNSSMFGIDMVNESTVSISNCKEFLSMFQDILKRLSNHRIKQILEIKSSKKFIERLVLQFTQKQSNINKYTNQLFELDAKRTESNATLESTKKKLDDILNETKLLKSKLESELSIKLFNKKKINIIYKL